MLLRLFEKEDSSERELEVPLNRMLQHGMLYEDTGYGKYAGEYLDNLRLSGTVSLCELEKLSITIARNIKRWCDSYFYNDDQRKRIITWLKKNEATSVRIQAALVRIYEGEAGCGDKDEAFLKKSSEEKELLLKTLNSTEISRFEFANVLSAVPEIACELGSGVLKEFLNSLRPYEDVELLDVFLKTVIKKPEAFPRMPFLTHLKKLKTANVTASSNAYEYLRKNGFTAREIYFLNTVLYEGEGTGKTYGNILISYYITALFEEMEIPYYQKEKELMTGKLSYRFYCRVEDCETMFEYLKKKAYLKKVLIENDENWLFQAKHIWSEVDLLKKPSMMWFDALADKSRYRWEVAPLDYKLWLLEESVDDNTAVGFHELLKADGLQDIEDILLDNSCKKSLFLLIKKKLIKRPKDILKWLATEYRNTDAFITQEMVSVYEKDGPEIFKGTKFFPEDNNILLWELFLPRVAKASVEVRRKYFTLITEVLYLDSPKRYYEFMRMLFSKHGKPLQRPYRGRYYDEYLSTDEDEHSFMLDDYMSREDINELAQFFKDHHLEKEEFLNEWLMSAEEYHQFLAEREKALLREKEVTELKKHQAEANKMVRRFLLDNCAFSETRKYHSYYDDWKEKNSEIADQMCLSMALQKARLLIAAGDVMGYTLQMQQIASFTKEDRYLFEMAKRLVVFDEKKGEKHGNKESKGTAVS